MRNISRAFIGSFAIVGALSGQVFAEGLPDILGIQLGMPAQDAHAKLQAQLPKNKIQVQSTPLPTIEKPVIFSFTSAPAEAVAMGMEGDQVTVDVTLPPNKQAVWRVNRTHYFPGNGIPKSTLLASVREKYGKETIANELGDKTTTDDNKIATLLWLMDEQGHPIPPPGPIASGSDPLPYCYPSRTGDPRPVVETPGPTYGNKRLEWCLSSYTAVTVGFQQSPAMPELSTQLYVTVLSLPFGARAGEATKKWKQDIAEGKYKQDLEKAKQQEKPKL
jgi:hypothetical protein